MNSEDIIAKLESIFLELNITPSMFADQIGVQRSSISHLLSGRNKPSLDLVLKIVHAFPQIDLYWLLGQKEFKEKLNLKIKTDQSAPTETVENIKIEEPLKTKKADPKIEITKTTANSKSSEVEKIVVFYRDGTFLEYAPRES